MHNKDMPKAEDAPASKKDLSLLGNKLREDISGVRSELKQEITGVRDELKQEIKQEIAAVRSEQKAGFRELAVAIVRTEAKMDAWGERIETGNERFRSDMLRFAEGFASRTKKVENDQIILIHRMDQLEKRVSGLESRRQG